MHEKLSTLALHECHSCGNCLPPRGAIIYACYLCDGRHQILSLTIQISITAENVGDVVGQLKDIFSEGTSAQDQSEGNLAVVQNVFSRAAELAGNVSYSEDVSVFSVLFIPYFLTTMHNKVILLLI